MPPIRVDRRVGSVHLTPYLTALGIKTELTTLPFGDLAFEGRGPDERPVPVGVELKTIRDLLNGLTTGRFVGHQLPGLLANYEHVWLLVQGYYRLNQEGVLQVRQGRQWVPLSLGGRQFNSGDLLGLLTTLEVKAGLHVRQVVSHVETAQTLAGLYRWWTGKAFDQHRSHLGFHDLPDPHVRLVDPPLVARVAKELPGVGWQRAHAVAERFPSVKAMVEADVKTWQQIDGIGRTLAGRIVGVLS